MPIYSIKKESLRQRVSTRRGRSLRTRRAISASVDVDTIPAGSSMLPGNGLTIVFLGIAFLGAVSLYVVAMNASAVRGATVRALEDEIIALESQRSELEIHAAHLRAQSHAQINQQEGFFEPVVLDQYIQIIDQATVAQK